VTSSAFATSYMTDSRGEKPGEIMKSQLLTILICVPLLSLTQPSWARKWTDNTGKFSIEAELVEVKDDKVVLERTNGTKTSVPINRLSETDRRYLKSLAESDLQPSNGGIGVFLSYPDAVTEPPEWNDGNPPFDLAEFFQAPPAEENAASLYLDALFDFSPGEMDVLFPEMTEQERKQWRLRSNRLYKEKKRLKAQFNTTVSKMLQFVPSTPSRCYKVDHTFTDIEFKKLECAE
jgi:hypothetical protein